MSKRYTLAKNSALNLLGYGYVLIASFFSIPILLDSLGVEGFGLYTLIVSIVPLASSLDLGLTGAVVRKLALPNLSKNERWTTMLSSVQLFLSLAIFLGVMIFLLVYYGGSLITVVAEIPKFVLRAIALLLGAIVGVNMFSHHYISVLQGHQRFDLYNLRVLIVGTATTLVSAYIAKVNGGIVPILMAQFVFYVLTLIVLMLAVAKVTHDRTFSLWPYSRSSLRDLTGYGLRYFVGHIAGRVRIYASRYYLGATVSGAAVALYTIPQSIVNQMLGALQQVGTALFPIGASLSSKKGISKIRKLLTSLELWILLFGLVQIVVVRMVGRQFLMWWLKNPQVTPQAFAVWKIMSVFFVVTALSPMVSNVLSALNYPEIPSVFSVYTMIIQLMLLFILVPKMGIVGAAYAELGSAVIVVPIFLIVGNRIMKIHKFR